MEELEKKIGEIVIQNQDITIEEILDDLKSYVELKYERKLEEKELEIISDLKDKLIERLYRLPRHEFILRNTAIEKKFHFDELEMKYLNQCLSELHHEGLIETNYMVKLTEKGILRAKELS